MDSIVKFLKYKFPSACCKVRGCPIFADKWGGNLIRCGLCTSFSLFCEKHMDEHQITCSRCGKHSCIDQDESISWNRLDNQWVCDGCDKSCPRSSCELPIHTFKYSNVDVEDNPGSLIKFLKYKFPDECCCVDSCQAFKQEINDNESIIKCRRCHYSFCGQDFKKHYKICHECGNSNCLIEKEGNNIGDSGWKCAKCNSNTQNEIIPETNLVKTKCKHSYANGSKECVKCGWDKCYKSNKSNKSNKTNTDCRHSFWNNRNICDKCGCDLRVPSTNKPKPKLPINKRAFDEYFKIYREYSANNWKEIYSESSIEQNIQCIQKVTSEIKRVFASAITWGQIEPMGGNYHKLHFSAILSDYSKPESMETDWICTNDKIKLYHHLLFEKTYQEDFSHFIRYWFSNYFKTDEDTDGMTTYSIIKCSISQTTNAQWLNGQDQEQDQCNKITPSIYLNGNGEEQYDLLEIFDVFFGELKLSKYPITNLILAHEQECFVKI